MAVRAAVFSIFEKQKLCSVYQPLAWRGLTYMSYGLDENLERGRQSPHKAKVLT